MKVFITGTDTNIGKTIVSSWICLHTGAEYFKPIQSGLEEETDSEIVARLAGVKVHAECYRLRAPLSPHLSARLDGVAIDMNRLVLPSSANGTGNLVVEGAGGLMVPINEREFMIDVIGHFELPVILVARSSLGTINHTLLSLKALRDRNIKILGVVMSGEPNHENKNAIETYGTVRVIAQIPRLECLTTESLCRVPFSLHTKAF